MKINHYSPDRNRLSVLTATILLAFSLARIISTATYALSFQVFGRTIRFGFDMRLVVLVLTVGLTATGIGWLLRDHPMLKDKHSFEHLFVPMLTTLVLGIPLYSLPATTLWWWIGFGVGGILLVFVFWAEYVVISPGDTSYPTATILLSVISFALYLILVLALRYVDVRLFLLEIAFFMATFLVSLRTLHLRLGRRWDIAWALGIALIGAQLTAGLHYLPLSPVRYGVFLLAPLYALTSLAASLLEGMPLRSAMVEPIFMFSLILGTGILLG